MSNGDKESPGDERSEHGTEVIHDEVQSQMPPPESLMENFTRNFPSSMAQNFPFHGAQSSRSRRSSQFSRKAILVGQFQDLNPPTYRGNEGPEMAEQWIERLDEMFDVLDYSDPDRIILAEFNLYGKANRWWEATKSTFGDMSEGTWEDFKRIFLDKYFPFTVRQMKAREFELLTHGNMTVNDYEERFLELSKYAAHLVQDPIERARRFEYGLNPQILINLAAFMLEDYDDLYCRAQIIERTLKETGEYCVTQGITSSSSCGKRPFRGSQVFQDPSKKGSTFSSGSRGSSSGHSNGGSGVPRCSSCGTRHRGDMCVRGTPLCFRCKQPGHLHRNCPLEGQEIPTELSYFRSSPPRLGPSRLGPPPTRALSLARGQGPPWRPPA